MRAGRARPRPREPDRPDPGNGDGPSLALLGHTDVVPADPRDWQHPPFAGHLDGDGYVWGRGAIDMKNETASRAVTLAVLARSGFRPRGDLMLIAEADEETAPASSASSGSSASGPTSAPDFVINEGASERLGSPTAARS